MERFFSIFGKVMLVLLVLGSLIYGGYYFGKKNKQAENLTTVTKSEVTVEATPISAPTSLPQITVVGGLPKSAGLSFDQYSVITPFDWTSKKESQTAMDEKLILEKEGYEIDIFQAATGGAVCLYKGDADFEGPSSKFEAFVVLTTKDGRNLRRSFNKGDSTFTICQKSSDGSYQEPTNYGHISIKTSANPTAEMLTEIDSIISSLKKI